MSAGKQAHIDQFELPHPAGGGSLRISASHPWPRNGSLGDLPVLFVMDADFEFGMAAEIARFMSMGGTRSSALVVGIGYDETDFAVFMRRRTADLTPPLGEAGRQALGGFIHYIGDGHGGADALLDVLIDILMPEIARRYPEVAIGKRALFGHSLGGLFAAHALLTRPGAFSAFLPASPSLWWNDFAILRLLPGLSEKLAMLEHKPRVLVTVGGREQELPTGVPQDAPITLAELQTLVRTWRTIDAATEFAGALREAGLADVGDVVFADETHDSVIPAAITRSLGFFLAGMNP